MNFQEAIASLGRPKTLGEALAAIRAERGDQAAETAQERVVDADVQIPTGVDSALQALREDHGPRATRWIQQRFGISLRQAQRYMRGEGLSARTRVSRARRDAVVAAAAEPRQAAAQRVRQDVMRQASRRWVAAGLLRRATRVTVGRVGVWDKSRNRPAGTRGVGSHRVGSNGLTSGQLAVVAAMLEQGDEQSALHAFSDALLDAYAVSKGDPPGTVSGPLSIYEYLSGIQIET